eukprot:6438021-Amphidinium_carterae.1
MGTTGPLAGALPLERESRKGTPFPLLSTTAWAELDLGALWQIYIDDVDLIELKPIDQESKVVTARSEHKAGEREKAAKRLGYWLDGRAGKLGIGGARAGKLLGVSLHMMQSDRLSKREAQICS